MDLVFQNFYGPSHSDPETGEFAPPELGSSIHQTMFQGVTIGIHFDMGRHPDRRCIVHAHSSSVGPMRLRLEKVLDDSPPLMSHWRCWTVNRSSWMHNGPSPMETTVQGEVAVLLEMRPADPLSEAILLMQVAKMEVTLLCAEIEHVLHGTVLQNEGPPVAG